NCGPDGGACTVIESPPTVTSITSFAGVGRGGGRTNSEAASGSSLVSGTEGGSLGSGVVSFVGDRMMCSRRGGGVSGGGPGTGIGGRCTIEGDGGKLGTSLTSDFSCCRRHLAPTARKITTPRAMPARVEITNRVGKRRRFEPGATPASPSSKTE